MTTFDVNRFNTVKVGELRAALQGVDDQVRACDVPAVRALLEEPVSPALQALVAELGLFGALLNSLALTFSQQADERDLELARLLALEGSAMRAAAAALAPDQDGSGERVEGSRAELADRCVAKAAELHMYALAAVLENLRKGLEGDEVSLTTAKTALSALERAAKPTAAIARPSVVSLPGRRAVG